MMKMAKRSKRNESTSPSHVLKMLDHDSSFWARVGAGWEKDEYISIKLNPGVVLDWNNHPTLILVINESWKE